MAAAETAVKKRKFEKIMIICRKNLTKESSLVVLVNGMFELA